MHQHNRLTDNGLMPFLEIARIQVCARDCRRTKAWRIDIELILIAACTVSPDGSEANEDVPCRVQSPAIFLMLYGCSTSCFREFLRCCCCS